MIRSITAGFIEHGHLAGTRAHLVSVGVTASSFPPRTFSRDDDQRLPYYLFIESTGNAGDLEAEYAVRVYRQLTDLGMLVFLGVRPGVAVPDAAAGYRSILRVLDGDLAHVTRHGVEQRCMSVSVHAWMGSGMLDVLESAAEFPHGRSLILADEDFGEAKVYLAATPTCSWKLVRAHPYNDIEPAEFNEMTRGKAN